VKNLKNITSWVKIYYFALKKEQNIKFIAGKIKYIIIAFISVFILLSIPELVIQIQGRERIQAEIDKKLDAAGLAYAYDGISLSGYRGITLYNLKISSDPNFSQGNLLLSADYAHIYISLYDILFSKEFITDKIIIDKAHFYYNNKSPFFDNSVLGAHWKVEDLIQVKNMKIKHLTLHIALERENYNKEIWVIDNCIVQYYLENKTPFLEISYNDRPWGKGEILFSPEGCESCTLFDGKYSVHLKKVPLNRFSWFVAPSFFKNGFGNYSGEYTYKSSWGEKKNVVQSHFWNGTLIFSDLLLTSEKKTTLDISEADFKGSLFYVNGDILANLDGHWGQLPYSFKMDKKESEIWPSLFNLQIISAKKKSRLILSHGVELTGLDHLRMNISKPGTSDRYSYRLLNMDLKIDDGELVFQENIKYNFSIDSLIFKMAENKYETTTSLKKGRSNLLISMAGKFQPAVKNILTTYLPHGGFKQKTITYDIVTMPQTATGKISLSKFDLEDIKDYVDTLRKVWKNEVKEGIQDGWQPAIFRERVLVQKYLLNSTADIDVNIEDWKYSEDQSHLDGKIIFSDSILSADLKSDHKMVNLVWNYKTSYPSIAADFDLNFVQENEISNLFFPENILRAYKKNHLTYSFVSYGDKVADIMQKHIGRGTFKIDNAELKFSNENIPGYLDYVEGSIYRSGEKAWISGIKGENKEGQLVGQAEWMYDSGSQWTLDTHYRTR